MELVFLLIVLGKVWGRCCTVSKHTGPVIFAKQKLEIVFTVFVPGMVRCGTIRKNTISVISTKKYGNGVFAYCTSFLTTKF